MHDILKRTFRDEMPEDLWPTGGDRWYAVIATLIKEPRNRWWDDTTTPNMVERRDDILLAAMTDARKEATSLMARDTDGSGSGAGSTGSRCSNRPSARAGSARSSGCSTAATTRRPAGRRS